MRGIGPLTWPTLAALAAVAAGPARSQPTRAAAPSAEPQRPARIEVETRVERLRSDEDGRTVLEPLSAAPAAGDELVYTVSFVNAGGMAATDVRITQPIPPAVELVADSAVAPRAEVTYSVDGGRSFGWAEELVVRDGDRETVAAAGAYTHVRWRLAGAVEPGARGFVRFRATVR